ncbi:serine carboxypeptidase-like 20 [Lathyrus oleraceus]|uniref:serine carboxypeptidase-like 20 n=1 Tax=Pisum sativum TaxID=3888 RepID=UPI0021D1F438|nr:serine carboxypeptidase-like 20 [Pisum sativum]XP_050905031.1 serine carboxypeptidase-like 20 [Pisum sativum]XP_050905032.1 serine carboxypeptidase-like 20 [Pisum sativum]
MVDQDVLVLMVLYMNMVLLILTNLSMDPCLSCISIHTVSNIIYLDSPVGVGFSYSKNTSQYETGDEKTATDSHTFLLKWFELYPEFLANPLYLVGESYAGVYVPTLAHKVVQGIEAGIKPKRNFKGYLIVNPVADEQFDGNALVPFAHGMGLISDQILENITKACNGTFYATNSSDCNHWLSNLNEVLHLWCVMLCS